MYILIFSNVNFYWPENNHNIYFNRSSETRAKGILRRFPNVNMDALKARYPLVDVEKIKNHKEARGHFLPK